MPVARPAAAFPHVPHWTHLANPEGNCSICTSCSRGPGVRTKFPRVKKSQAAKTMASWSGASCISHILLVSQTLGLKVTPKTEPISCCTPLDTGCQDRVTVSSLLSQGLRSQCRSSRYILWDQPMNSKGSQRDPPLAKRYVQEVWPIDCIKQSFSFPDSRGQIHLCPLVTYFDTLMSGFGFLKFYLLPTSAWEAYLLAILAPHQGARVMR